MFFPRPAAVGHWRHAVTKQPRLTLLGNPRIGMASQRLAPRPKVSDPYYSTPEHRAWRLAVCRRAGWRCEWIDNGQRCEKSIATGDRMFADHIKERRDGGADPMVVMGSGIGNGVWGLCRRGSKGAEPHGMPCPFFGPRSL